MGPSYVLFVYSSAPNAPRSTRGLLDLAEAAEELSDVVEQEIWGVVGGPVAPAVEL